MCAANCAQLESGEARTMIIQAGDSLAIAAKSAIVAGETARLQQLLDENPGLASARIVDASGTSRTLLHVAADWPGHFPNGAHTVAVLATAGADVNAALHHTLPNRSPETPLHWTASSDDDLIDWLRSRGAKVAEDLQ